MIACNKCGKELLHYRYMIDEYDFCPNCYWSYNKRRGRLEKLINKKMKEWVKGGKE